MSSPSLSDVPYTSLSYQDCLDVIYGCSAFSGGGGGAKIWGKMFLDFTAEITGNEEICKLVELHHLPENQELVPVACFGRPEALFTSYGIATLSALAKVNTRGWEALYGKKMGVVTGLEVGPGNTIAPMYMASLSNAYVVDGDFQGRAVLKIGMLGPYIYGLPVRGCFSYITRDGIVPEDALAYEMVTTDEGTFAVVSAAIPTSTPHETEAFLGNMFTKAYPNSIFCIAFEGLKKEVLMHQGPEYTSGTYTPLFVPGTLSRSLEVGSRLYAVQKEEEAFQPLMEHGGVLIGRGRLLGIKKAPQGDRSDNGQWEIELADKTKLIGFYNNENVVIAIEKDDGKDVIPIMTTPNIMLLQALENFEGNFSCKIGECFTNDELWNFLTKNETIPQNLLVNVIVLPPAPLLLTSESLNMIAPNYWGVNSVYEETYPSMKNIPFIPCPTQFRAPTYKTLYQLLDPRTKKPLGSNQISGFIDNSKAAPQVEPEIELKES